MAGAPKIKVFIEGVLVPVSSVQRIQTEGEPTKFVVSLWPTNKGSLIRRGSYVVAFRFESDKAVLQKNDSLFGNYDVDGAWELFFDGYVQKKPTVSRREMRSTVLICSQWPQRMSSVYIHATSLSLNDIGSIRDKIFMGINPKSNEYFSLGGGSDSITNAISRIKARITSKESEGVAAGIIELAKEAVNFDPLYARISAITRLHDRIHCVENKQMTEFVKNENLINIISGQIDNLPTTSTLMDIINQLMYQSLYTSIMIPSPYYDSVAGVMYQVIYKPQLFFATPVISNVIFPGSVQIIQPIEDVMQSPTRMAVIGYRRLFGSEIAETFAEKIYYPESIGEHMSIDMKAEAYDAIDFVKKYTDEELIEERISPSSVGLPFPESVMRDVAEGTSELSLANMYGKYVFHIERNTSQPLSVTMDFDPYLICGLSGVIFDHQLGYILGRIRSIHDTIDINNNVANTVIEMVNVRVVPMVEDVSGVTSIIQDASLQISGYDDLFGAGGFFDDKFKNSNIGSNFYEFCFKSKAIYNVLDKTNPVSSALYNLYKKYNSIPGESVEKYIRFLKYRSVMTEKEYMDYIGAIPGMNDEKEIIVNDKVVDCGRYTTARIYKLSLIHI